MDTKTESNGGVKDVTSSSESSVPGESPCSSNGASIRPGLDDEDASTEDLWPLWNQIICNWDAYRKDPGPVKELIIKGVPNHFRSIVWQLLTDAHVPGGTSLIHQVRHNQQNTSTNGVNSNCSSNNNNNNNNNSSNGSSSNNSPGSNSNQNGSANVSNSSSSSGAAVGAGESCNGNGTSASSSSSSSSSGNIFSSVLPSLHPMLLRSNSTVSSSSSTNGNSNGSSFFMSRSESNSSNTSLPAAVLRSRYMEYLRASSVCEKIIRRDIARTYPEIDFFRDEKGPGQGGLFNVMKAYSVHDAEVGYCQGSAFLVGLLLLHMPEEDAFAVLVRMMEEYRLREMYKPTMAELGLCIYQLECMVQELMPELHRHFESQNYHTSMYASSWFLTLFTASLPLNLAARVIDLFLSEGMEIIFKISLGILMICKVELLRLDMEGLLRYFQKEMPARVNVDANFLISTSLSVKYDYKKLKKLSKDYNVLKTKEQEELVELRRLRTENRLLRQRIENLEVESAELADKLIQGQVSRAQEAEDNFVIKRDLANSRKREEDLKEKLEESSRKVSSLEESVKTKQSATHRELQSIIESLQEELVAVKLREAEAGDEMKSMRDRIHDLEEVNHRLRDLPPEHTVAQLQEELISVKLREAEANLSMKELRNRISDLQSMWEEHLVNSHNSGSEANSQPNSLEKTSTSLPVAATAAVTAASSLSVTSSPLKMVANAVKRSSDMTAEISRLKQELLTAKLREAEAVSELKELRQKVMELETANQVSLNQIRRQNEEINRFKEFQDATAEKQREFNKTLQEEKRKYIDLDSRMKELQMMNRIKDLEQTQAIAELRQKLSSFDIKREEMVTEKKLIEAGSEPQDKNDLHNRMSELQTEMFRLDANNMKLNSFLTSTATINGTDE